MPKGQRIKLNVVSNCFWMYSYCKSIKSVTKDNDKGRNADRL